MIAYLDRVLPVWGKIVLVVAVFGVIGAALGYGGARLIEAYVPPEDRNAFWLGVIGVLILLKLDAIERRLK